MTHVVPTAALQVLLIEDSPTVLAAFQNMIQTQNLKYNCTIVSSISETERTLMLKEFDVIVADYSLGNGTILSSFDLMNSTPTVFIIAPGDEAVAVCALHLGVYDYLTKDRDNNYIRILPHRIETAIAQKGVQIALRESQERYRDLFENSGELLQCVSSTGALMDVNPSWRRTMGYTTEDIAKLNFFDLLPPDSRSSYVKFFQRVLEGETVDSMPIKLRTKSNQWLSLTGKFARRFRGGMPSTVRGILSPLTDDNATAEDSEGIEQQLEKSDKGRNNPAPDHAAAIP